MRIALYLFLIIFAAFSFSSIDAKDAKVQKQPTARLPKISVKMKREGSVSENVKIALQFDSKTKTLAAKIENLGSKDIYLVGNTTDTRHINGVSIFFKRPGSQPNELKDLLVHPKYDYANAMDILPQVLSWRLQPRVPYAVTLGPIEFRKDHQIQIGTAVYDTMDLKGSLAVASVDFSSKEPTKEDKLLSSHRIESEPVLVE